MSSTDREALERFSSACRKGLETLAAKKGSMFQGFPRGSCGPAAELVGRLLEERLHLQGAYVCGSNHPELDPEGISHAWVEAGGFVIDITHDQFAGTGVSGWVVAASSAWHVRFRDIKKRAGFCTPSGWPMYPHDGYAAMLRALGDDRPG